MNNVDLGLYILIDKVPAKITDIIAWGLAMEKSRVVEQTTFTDKIDHEHKVKVSTVFIGIDHAFGGESGPLLFETMIFGGKHDHYQERYKTWDEALKGHRRLTKMVKEDFII